MIVEWFTPPRRSYEWFGQTGTTLAQISNGGTSAVASVIGPPGPAGGGGGGVAVGPGFQLVGNEIRYEFSTLTRA